MEGVALYSYRRLSAANKEDGRGVRAGNEIAKHFAGNNVDVIIYAVEKSLDSYKFNLLHCKQTFISQLKSGALGARTIDEGAMDEKSGMNFSEYMALLSGNTDLLDKAKLEKKNDSLWIPRGIVGFDRLLVHTPEFGLPLRVRKTAVTVDGPKITLRNASLKIGHSDMVATGEVMGLYRAMTKNETLKARLAISSEMIDCNQLINSFSLSEDSVSVAVTDTVSPTEMKLFVLPGNLDFELQTDLKKVVFEKVEFEDVCGKVDLKNRTLYLRNLEMRALDADMKAVMVYRADSVRGGYTGFDFKIRDINIAKLVDFIPSMDTIVPMLRSFEGRVQFDVAAEARLDSNMNIRIPTLRSAMYIKGDSLMLMDGETFAEISKMLMFKNKKKNVFDSISVNVVVNDGSVLVYPFQVSIDRYKAAIGGEQGLDMNFKYHISILKSPLPFKAGVNISGNLDKMKIRVGKAKYKDDVTPAAIHKVDSTRMDLGRRIVERFHRIVGVR